VRLEARDEAGATAVAERSIVATGVTCRSQTSEVAARVRGDCCLGEPPCRRRCDYENRGSAVDCGDAFLEREVRFPNGESRGSSSRSGLGSMAAK
jgi:hypothetical protein